MKRYLKLTILSHGGTTFTQHLKLGEVSEISFFAQNNKEVNVKMVQSSNETYNAIFGIPNKTKKTSKVE